MAKSKGTAAAIDSMIGNDIGASMRRLHVNSRPNRIATLEVGESESITKRLDFDSIDKETLRSERTSLSNTMSRAIAHAKQRCDGEFVMDSGHYFTQSGDIMLVVSVTRTA